VSTPIIRGVGGAIRVGPLTGTDGQSTGHQQPFVIGPRVANFNWNPSPCGSDYCHGEVQSRRIRANRCIRQRFRDRCIDISDSNSWQLTI
ncbi:MAG: hypothetical protein KDA99_01540, partial [Planctomycetales bacterium]|nr:hypothetical protein [Planctomycetales bacterium]